MTYPLTMKPEKTRVVSLREGVDFLGYRITLGGVWPSEKSVKRFQEKLRSLTLRHETRPLKEVVQRVMPVIRGWTNYFSMTEPSRLWNLGTWILDRIRLCAVKHWWRAKWQEEASSAQLYGLGLRLPYVLLKWGAR